MKPKKRHGNSSAVSINSRSVDSTSRGTRDGKEGLGRDQSSSRQT